ncbi:MAG: GNAT family N-acetyltransferase [Clostridiales bacterium]|nr:GNAT family N-acetyltransferase [Clostridiales bacterium]
MILKTEHLPSLEPFGKTALGCRILAAAEAYGLSEPFAQFWTQGESAAVCKLDDTVILEIRRAADLEELASFLRMSGASRLLCSWETAGKMSLPAVRRGAVMTLSNIKKYTLPADAQINPGVRDIYSLLCRCESPSFPVPEFEPFYLDLSHRIRHGTALAVGIRKEGALAVCAVCAAMAGPHAVISAVAVAPEFRRMGLGRTVTEALLSRLPQKKVSVFRAEDENEAFYRSLDFLPGGTFAELML